MYRPGENISVIASFGPPNRIRPVRFLWGGRLLDVKEITYRWTTREGTDKLYHFAVTDGGALYELSFNASSLVWRLEGVEA